MINKNIMANQALSINSLESTSHLFLYHLNDLDVEVIQFLVVPQDQLVVASFHGNITFLRPVLVAFGSAPLYFPGHHGNDVRLVLPNHLPEAVQSVGQRSL